MSARASTAEGRPKILYIAGPGRSGSTILDQVLGELPGFVSTGELQMIWQRGLIERRPCGCSAPLPECPFWRAVLENGFGSVGEIEPRAVLALLDRYLPPNLVRLVRLRADARAHLRGRPSDARRYGEIIARLYISIAAAAEARVVVDSSKMSIGALLVSAFAPLDVYVLHLVRDPR